MRNTTERSEGIDARTLKLVGTKRDVISSEAQLLLDNNDAYNEMSNTINPYGDGNATERIVNILAEKMMSGGMSRR
jgi:UDP-N-acetylglucosamine 2-epimerase (non-hydrolysing)